MTTTIQTATKAAPEKGIIAYVPFGAKDEIKLSIEIIKRFVAIKTKSGATCDDAQAMKCLMLCQAQRLNPFAGDVFLAGFDGKNGPTFSLITAQVAFLKRAEVSPDYEGMESGVILQAEDGAITEREGDFCTGTEKVVGGWARVYRKGRKPTYRRLSIAAMKPPYETQFWNELKAPGQIVKCSESDALRSTFPTLLGGMYHEGEAERMQTIDITSAPASLVSVKKQVEDAPDGQDAQQETPAATSSTNAEISVQQELEDIVTAAGFTFEQFKVWAEASGNLPDADRRTGFNAMPTDLAKRLVKSKTGLLKGLAEAKASAK